MVIERTETRKVIELRISCEDAEALKSYVDSDVFPSPQSIIVAPIIHALAEARVFDDKNCTIKLDSENYLRLCKIVEQASRAFSRLNAALASNPIQCPDVELGSKQDVELGSNELQDRIDTALGKEGFKRLEAENPNLAEAVKQAFIRSTPTAR